MAGNMFNSRCAAWLLVVIVLHSRGRRFRHRRLRLLRAVVTIRTIDLSVGCVSG
jgi:hypothetical protein